MEDLKNVILTSENLNARLSPETKKLIADNYRQLTGFEPDDSANYFTGKGFFELLLRRAIEGVNNQSAGTEQINSLQTANIQLEIELRNTQSKLEDAETEIQNLRNAKPGGENGILLNLNPALSDLVDQCVNRASVKTGRKFTREDIIMNLFWEAVSTGRASLPIIFSSSEVANIIRKHKEGE